MRRLVVPLLFLPALLAAPLVAEAQQAPKVPRIATCRSALPCRPAVSSSASARLAMSTDMFTRTDRR